MDHNSIIDKTNYKVYKHAEDYSLAFICDKLIAPSVSLLNIKGYKTYASCSGHYKLEFYEYFDCDLSKLEEYSNDKRIIIKEVRDNSFDYWYEVDKTHIYILFSSIYKFDELPDGFEYINYDDKTCIDCTINYYDLENKRIRRDVECEIEEKNNILKSWVDKLPIYERND